MLSVVVAYAPTNEGSVKEKDQFYKALETTMRMIKKNDMVVCLCDFQCHDCN